MNTTRHFTSRTAHRLLVSAALVVTAGCGSSDGDTSSGSSPGGMSAGLGGASGAGGTTGIGGTGGGGGAGGAGGAAGGGGASGAAGAGGVDPVWGNAAVVCPTDAVDASAPALLGRDCDPIDPTMCGFPFPSSVYLSDDATTATGHKVTFGKTTLPRHAGASGTPMDPAYFTNRDGFSPGSPLMVHIPGATMTGLPDSVHIEDSVKPTSPTILLDTSTGMLVPHWMDVDISTSKKDRRALVLRPAVRLKNDTRYVVALRNVVDEGGNAIPASPFFRALRDGTSDCSPQLTALRKDLYTEMFTTLAGAGVTKTDLQLAWDFSTGSRTSVTRDLVKMRDEALAKYSGAFKYKIHDYGPEPKDPTVSMNINLTVTLPLYLEFAEPYSQSTPDKLPSLHRGPDGLPLQNGEFDYPLVIHVPKSAEGAGKASFPLLQYGHGLLGDRYEGSAPEFSAADGRAFLTKFGDNYHYLTFATDFMGFANTTDVSNTVKLDDSPLVTDGLSVDAKRLFSGLFERQAQGHLNQLLMMRFMMTVAAKGLTDDTGKVVFDGTIIDTTRRYYQGDSQGGIMGVAYMALSTDVTRGSINQGGGPYSLLLNRSQDWPLYGTVLDGAYTDPRAVQMFLGLMQMHWDTTEPDGYMTSLAGDTLPCADSVLCPGGKTPDHQIMIYDGIGDCQVTPLSSHLLARTIGAKSLSPAPRKLFGIDESPDIKSGSGLVEWTFGLPDAPVGNMSPDTKYCGDANDPHDKINRLDPAFAQIDYFFGTGEIKPFCKDVCSCYDAMPEAGCDSLPAPDWMK